MKKLVMNKKYPCFCEELNKFGYEIIPTKKINTFLEPEQYHADMQILCIKNKVITLDDCIKKPGKNYPENILLNCLYHNNKLYGTVTDDDGISAPENLVVQNSTSSNYIEVSCDDVSIPNN